jgi:hypothetical protein
MDIKDIRDLLLKWLQSCETTEQVFFFKEVVEDYIVKRFEGKETQLVIDAAKGFLIDQMDIQLTILNQKIDV